jgi:arabinose-5-phosphate isomerase
VNVGPILAGVGKPAHVLTQSVTVRGIVNMSAIAVVDAQERVIGVFTDGDLRRTLDQPVDIHLTAVDAVMTRGGITAHADMLAAEALRLMENKRINALLVVDGDQRLIGALNMHDLLRAGVV